VTLESLWRRGFSQKASLQGGEDPLPKYLRCAKKRLRPKHDSVLPRKKKRKRKEKRAERRRPTVSPSLGGKGGTRPSGGDSSKVLSILQKREKRKDCNGGGGGTGCYLSLKKRLEGAVPSLRPFFFGEKFVRLGTAPTPSNMGLQ